MGKDRTGVLYLDDRRREKRYIELLEKSVSATVNQPLQARRGQPPE